MVMHLAVSIARLMVWILLQKSVLRLERLICGQSRWIVKYDLGW